jgi:hypothetical protein
LPPEGIRSAQPVELFLRVLKVETDSTLQSSEGFSCNSVRSNIVMPSMSGMPAIVPAIRWLGYPGSYAIKATLPHGGFYRIALGCVPAGSAEIQVTFLIEVSDPLSGDAALPPPFRLKTNTTPSYISAGKTVRIAISVWSADKDSGSQITRFETVHEKQLHLFLIREDLGSFFHEHPAPNPDGSFTLSFKFPTAGNWTVFADVAPQGSGSYILSSRVVVHGVRPVSSGDLIATDENATAEEDISLHREPISPIAHRSNWLLFTLTDKHGNKLSGFEPWLGAPAHLMMVERDDTTFVHSHPSEGSQQSANGGLFAFEARFPKAGIYKGWLQFKRMGRVVTLTFVVQVT